MNFSFLIDAETAPGSQLRSARRSRRRLTQRGLADASGLDLDTIAGLEAGRGTVGSWLRALKALDFLIDGCGSLDIGPWLIKLRSQTGLSQEKAATSSGLSKPTIIKLERGEGRLDSLMRLLSAYGVPLQIRAMEDGAAPPKLPLEVLHGDATDVLKQFPDEHFHSCVTDPPYGLAYYPSAMINEIMRAWVAGRDYDFSGHRSFMGKSWDEIPQPSHWREVLRVLKPGAHLAVFVSPRTSDLLGMSLRLAGAEIRDSIAWITTGGFPRSQNVGKMLAKRALRERVKSGQPINLNLQGQRRRYPGAGGRAKPIAGHSLSAEEILALAPEAGPALENFSGIRSGGLRPSHQVVLLARKPFSGSVLDNVQAHGTGGLHVSSARHRVADGTSRYPANVISDLPELERYYFAPRVLAEEKDRFLSKPNPHPTVKPISLMQWLVRLLSAKGATILDPFAGSGSTGCACALEQRAFVGIEREQEFVEIARTRIEGWAAAARSYLHDAPG